MSFKATNFLKRKWLYLVLIALSLTPIIWFIGRGNVLINGVDTNFPLNPWVWFVRRLYAWNDVSNAGMDFSFGTSGLFFHFVQVVPFLLGFSLQSVQLLSLLFWFSSCSFCLSKLSPYLRYLRNICFSRFIWRSSF